MVQSLNISFWQSQQK